MSARRFFQCPNCGDAIGELLHEDGNPLRCDYRPTGWSSKATGKDPKTKKQLYEYSATTAPGCGGILRICVHGLRICDTCPPQFTPATEKPIPLPPLADVLKREKAEVEQRREATKRSDRSEPDTGFIAPTGRVQLPHLGESEPTTYKPPKGGRGKRA